MTTNVASAITGASGFLGGVLLERLRAGGPVRVLARRRNDRTDAWEQWGCRVVIGDLHDQRALAELVDGATVVYHCAATMAKGDASLSERVNVVGTENLAHAAYNADVRRLVYVSSISVFAATPADRGVINEDVTPEHIDELNCYGRTKYQGEERLREIAAAGGPAFTIIRPTNIYGPGSGPWFHQFERLLRRLPIAPGDLEIDVVYVDDVADALVQAAHASAAANAVFHVGHEMVKMNRFITEVGRVTGRRARTLPTGADRVLRYAIDRAYRQFTGTRMSMSLVNSVRYPHERASAAFGYAPRVGLEEGFTRLTEWYRTAAPATA